MKFKILLVIPSRFNSTRLPGKPLKKIGGKTLIQRVYEKALKINCAKTIVATDDKRIYNHCVENEIECLITKKNHKTGSDRVSEVSKKYKYNWILNIQGDEPLININDVKNFIKKSILLFKKQKFCASTMYYKNIDNHKLNLNEARLLINSRKEIIIGTRKKITKERNKYYLKHIGIYLYRKKFIEKFPKLKKRYLENDQKLEFLRIIENGYKIVAIKAKHFTTGVDTQKNLFEVRKIFKLKSFLN
tara:strand:+ start:5674 stop:6411 length:738 start_codon:yes stop_codon:yes gene_type:complete